MLTATKKILFPCDPSTGASVGALWKVILIR